MMYLTKGLLPTAYVQFGTKLMLSEVQRSVYNIGSRAFSSLFFGNSGLTIHYVSPKIASKLADLKQKNSARGSMGFFSFF